MQDTQRTYDRGIFLKLLSVFVCELVSCQDKRTFLHFEVLRKVYECGVASADKLALFYPTNKMSCWEPGNMVEFFHLFVRR